MAKQLIRFDWAIKKLLRDKANFGILEGFLTVLLGEPMIIERILESESNQESEGDRHNRVDMLVKNQKGELIIIEVQNSKQYDYFHRMIYGTSKVISEYIQKGESYANVKKVISVTIAYFDLGQGEDYVYHGTNEFHGIHKHDVLTLADKQKALYDKQAVHEIFPEYWIIKAEKFDNQVSDKLDEWIYFLKNSEVREDFTAPGLDEAREKLDELRMNDEERANYKWYLKRLRDIASEQHTKVADMQQLIKETEERAQERGIKKGIKQGIRQGRKQGIEEGIEQGREQGRMHTAKKLLALGIDNQAIAQATGLTIAQLEALKKELE